MGNKSMLTNKFNRTIVVRNSTEQSLQAVTNNGSNDSNVEKYSTNPIKSVSKAIRPSQHYVYSKPQRLHSIKPNEYTDANRHGHYCNRIGNRYVEIPKTSYRIPSFELKQFSQLVRVSCNVLASLNGYVSYTDVRKHLLDNSFVILDNKLLQDVVRSFLQTRPHLVKRVSNNRVKANDNNYGFESEPVRPSNWYDKERWSKLMRICEL